MSDHSNCFLDIFLFDNTVIFKRRDQTQSNVQLFTVVMRYFWQFLSAIVQCDGFYCCCRCHLTNF